METIFRAIVIEETPKGSFEIKIRLKNISDLPQNDVLIKVKYSGLNYKDALSASGYKGITKNYPHTPGIDAAGVVINSTNSNFSEGDEVIVTGYDLGMNTSGGFAEYIRVPSEWVVKRPHNLTLQECMIIGTSGFTAASGIFEFIKHDLSPLSGEVLVTGASGAVGSMAVSMLAKAGYNVCAATGKSSASVWLKDLGASRVIDRTEIEDTSSKALLPSQWAGVIETVGGNILSTAIRSTKDRGIIVNCGMISSNMLNVSVLPFIIRAVRLIGIASAETPMQRRLEIWDLIQSQLKPTSFEKLVRIVKLEDIPSEIERMLNNEHQGKVIVNLE